MYNQFDSSFLGYQINVSGLNEKGCNYGSSKNLGSYLGAIFFHFLSEISEELCDELEDELEYYFFLNLSLVFFSLLLDLFAIL